MNLWTTFVYIPVSFAYIIPCLIWFPGVISDEERKIPQYKFLIMGFLDGAAGIMQTFASNVLPGGLLILLQQSAIPISMVLSKWLMKAQYKLQHYIGAVIVLLGLGVVLYPLFAKGGASGSGDHALVWVFVMILSCVPMTLSSVYKERALGDVEMDVVYLNGYVAIYQFLFGILMAVPAVYATPGLKIGDLGKTIFDGFRCYLGINSILGNATATSVPPRDDCRMSPLFVNSYLVFNIAYNVLIILILKHGSANLLFLALTIMVPAGNVAFALKFVPGHKPMEATDIAGLIIIMIGLTTYRFMGFFVAKCKGKKETKEEELTSKKRIYLSANQAEAAQGVLETMSQRVVIVRDSRAVRSAYLSRLGIEAQRPPHMGGPNGSINGV